jgi:hypothetical protein
MELVVEADRWSIWQAISLWRPNLANCQKRLTTGGAGVSEFVEIGNGTQEIQKALKWIEYYRRKYQPQGLEDDLLEVGVSHSSHEASNDRGAKG